ncbi:Ig-like domain-containing protein, partial [Methylobacterium sp. Leaf113]|uniref:Ig-like domain-containing protein n=1 Tax=Methylobacterium sp. Leaf113 TaxID=1736259 RepID=UPI003FCDF038
MSAALKADTGLSAKDGVTSDATLSGSTDAGSTVSVRIDGATTAETVKADASGNWVYTPKGLSDGSHTIVASVTDPAGNVGSATVAFTLDTTAPAVAIGLQADTGASASDRLTSDAALRGKGDANATVQFTVDGQASVRTAVADASGNWVYTPRGLSDGEHTIVATETDAAGNTGSSTLTFTLDTVAPVISAALKADTGLSAKDGVTSDATLSGSTDAG